MNAVRERFATGRVNRVADFADAPPGAHLDFQESPHRGVVFDFLVIGGDGGSLVVSAVLTAPSSTTCELADSDL
jgi:hypothetical protein